MKRFRIVPIAGAAEGMKMRDNAEVPIRHRDARDKPEEYK